MAAEKRHQQSWRRLLAATGVALVLCLALAPTILAGVYGSNTGAARLYTGTSVAAGSFALVDLETAAVLANSAIAHPMQLASNSSSGFIGWGTMRGEGTHVPGASSNCPDNYGTGWHAYVDGEAFQVYFCRAGYGDLSSNAQSQAFKFLRVTCSGSTKWGFYLNANLKTCQTIDGSSGTLSDGSEDAFTPTVQNLGIRYHNLQVKFASGWAYWNDNNVDLWDPGYAIQDTSARDFTVYLP